jgi:hypothetical protein
MRRVLSLVVLAAVSTGGAVLSPAAAAMPAGAPRISCEQAEKLYFFTGNARVISDITQRETFWPVSGCVHASSRQEALELARAAAWSQAALAGSVVDVDVHITN